MKKSIYIFLIFSAWVLNKNISLAQTPDAENCKDHEFFSRFSKFYIQECKENYNEYEFITGQDETETHEGTVTEILYTYDGPYGPELPSILQIVKNYENAMVKMGGTKVYSRTKSDGYWTGATFQLNKDGYEYWVGIYHFINDPVDQYSFILLAKEGMKQEITAQAMFETINTGNTLSLYINFETGKSTIKDESKSIVDELFAMMKENPALKIIIDGHTDNVGSVATNKTLSEERAASVKSALVTKGILADRMKTTGYGQGKPIAENTTDDGRAKNRRVEISRFQ